MWEVTGGSDGNSDRDAWELPVPILWRGMRATPGLSVRLNSAPGLDGGGCHGHGRVFAVSVPPSHARRSRQRMTESRIRP
jgi:hypothetical protein